MRALPFLALALLALPAASAHGAPAGDVYPSGPFYRVLADFSDDCGGDGVTSACQGTNDLIALDVQEKQTADGEVLVFRLTLDAGQSGTLKDTVSFSANGQAKSFSVQSTDNKHFTGSGTDQVLDAHSLGDGARYQVDAILKLDHVGAVGAKLGNFQASAFRGSTKGDIMPGSYVTPLGTEGPAGDSCEDNSCPRKVDYTLQGPVYYLAFSLASGTQAATVGQGQGTTLHLNLHGERAGASGTLTLVATTDQGGRSELKVPYTVQDAGTSATTPPPSDTPTSKPSPAPAVTLVALLLLGVALRRRA